MERKHSSTYIMSSIKPSSASISDLAPFVAAVLKDKTVIDLNKDIEELREREGARLLVEVTGPGGTPVHYQASLKDGNTNSHHSELWTVYFEGKKSENGEDIFLTLNMMKNIEVRLGGVVVSDMRYSSIDINDGCCKFSDNEVDPQIGNIYFQYRDKSCSPIDSFICCFGPVHHEDYLSLIEDARDAEDLVDAINGSPDRFNQETPLSSIITGVEFNKEKIGSLLSIVGRMAISTTRAIANHTD